MDLPDDGERPHVADSVSNPETSEDGLVKYSTPGDNDVKLRSQVIESNIDIEKLLDVADSSDDDAYEGDGRKLPLCSSSTADIDIEEILAHDSSESNSDLDDTRNSTLNGSKHTTLLQSPPPTYASLSPSPPLPPRLTPPKYASAPPSYSEVSKNSSRHTEKYANKSKGFGVDNDVNATECITPRFDDDASYKGVIQRLIDSGITPVIAKRAVKVTTTTASKELVHSTNQIWKHAFNWAMTYTDNGNNTPAIRRPSWPPPSESTEKVEGKIIEQDQNKNSIAKTTSISTTKDNDTVTNRNGILRGKQRGFMEEFRIMDDIFKSNTIKQDHSNSSQVNSSEHSSQKDITPTSPSHISSSPTSPLHISSKDITPTSPSHISSSPTAISPSLKRLVDMGFEADKANAALEANDQNLEEAMEVLLSSPSDETSNSKNYLDHSTKTPTKSIIRDSGIQKYSPPGLSNGVITNSDIVNRNSVNHNGIHYKSSDIENLVSMGFPRVDVIRALNMCGNNVDVTATAMDIILSGCLNESTDKTVGKKIRTNDTSKRNEATTSVTSDIAGIASAAGSSFVSASAKMREQFLKFPSVLSSVSSLKYSDVNTNNKLDIGEEENDSQFPSNEQESKVHSSRESYTRSSRRPTTYGVNLAEKNEQNLKTPSDSVPPPSAPLFSVRGRRASIAKEGLCRYEDLTQITVALNKVICSSNNTSHSNLNDNSISSELGESNSTITTLFVNARWIAVGLSSGMVVLFDHFHQPRGVFQYNDEVNKDSAASNDRIDQTTLQNGIKNNDAEVTSLAISPDSCFLLVGHHNGRVVLWDIHTVKELCFTDILERSSKRKSIRDLLFLPKPSTIALILTAAGDLLSVKFRKMFKWARMIASVEAVFVGPIVQKAFAISVSHPPLVGDRKRAPPVIAITTMSPQHKTIILPLPVPGQRPKYRNNSPVLWSKSLAPPEPGLPVLQIILRWRWDPKWLTPQLAIGYGPHLQLLHMEPRRGFVELTHHKAKKSFVALEWVRKDLILYLTMDRQLCAFDTQTALLLLSDPIPSVLQSPPLVANYAASSSSKSLFFVERVSANSKTKTRVESMSALQQQVQAVHLRSDTERLSMFIASGRWIAALALGTKLCHGHIDEARGLLESFIKTVKVYDTLEGKSPKKETNITKEKGVYTLQFIADTIIHFASHFQSNGIVTAQLLEYTAKYCETTSLSELENEKQSSGYSSFGFSGKAAAQALAASLVRSLWYRKIMAPTPLLISFLVKHCDGKYRSWLSGSLMRADWKVNSAKAAIPVLVDVGLTSPMIFLATEFLKPPQFAIALRAVTLEYLKYPPLTLSSYSVDNDVVAVDTTKIDEKNTRDAAYKLLLFLSCLLSGVLFPPRRAAASRNSSISSIRLNENQTATATDLIDAARKQSLDISSSSETNDNQRLLHSPHTDLSDIPSEPSNVGKTSKYLLCLQVDEMEIDPLYLLAARDTALDMLLRPAAEFRNKKYQIELPSVDVKDVKTRIDDSQKICKSFYSAATSIGESHPLLCRLLNLETDLILNMLTPYLVRQESDDDSSVAASCGVIMGKILTNCAARWEYSMFLYSQQSEDCREVCIMRRRLRSVYAFVARMLMQNIEIYMSPWMILGVIRAFAVDTKIITESSIDVRENFVMVQVSGFQSSINNWGWDDLRQGTRQERIVSTCAQIAAAGMPWPAAALAARCGSACAVLDVFLGNVSDNSSSDSEQLKRAAFVYLIEETTRLAEMSQQELNSGDVMEGVIEIDARSKKQQKYPSNITADTEISNFRQVLMDRLEILIITDCDTTANLFLRLGDEGLPLRYIELLATHFPTKLLPKLRAFEFKCSDASFDKCASVCRKANAFDVAAELRWRDGATKEAESELVKGLSYMLEKLESDTLQKLDNKNTPKQNGHDIVADNDVQTSNTSIFSQNIDAILSLGMEFSRRHSEMDQINRAEFLWTSLLECILKVLVRIVEIRRNHRKQLSKEEVNEHIVRLHEIVKSCASKLLTDCSGDLPLTRLLTLALNSKSSSQLPLKELRTLIRSVLKNLEAERSMVEAAKAAATAACRRGHLIKLPFPVLIGDSEHKIASINLRAMKEAENVYKNDRLEVVEGAFLRLEMGELPNQLLPLQTRPAGIGLLPSVPINQKREGCLPVTPKTAKRLLFPLTTIN